MVPPTKESAATNTPNHAEPAEVGAVAVRSDHWKAFMDFLSVQSSVLNAAVPRHMYGLQAEAHRRYKVLEPMLDKYKFPDDLVEVTVTLDNGEQQKIRISQEALTAGVNLGEGSKVNDTVHGKKSVTIKNDVVDGDTTQQPKASIKGASKRTGVSVLGHYLPMHADIMKQIPEMSNTRPIGSDPAWSSGPRTSGQSNVSKPATNKRTASASQATAKSSEEASRQAASKTKQKAAYTSSLSKPQIAATTSATKSDMRRTLEKPTRVRVVPPKRSNPFQIPEAQEPNLANRRISKDSNTPKPDRAVDLESPTFAFPHHGSRVPKSFVRPDTPLKPRKTSDASNISSETTGSVGWKSADAGTKVDVGAHAVLKVKTNMNKAPPKDNTKASKNTDAQSQSFKPIIKPKVMTVDSKVIAADSKPATAKRPRSSDDVHVNDRPSKKVATKHVPAIDIGHHQTETRSDGDTSPGSLSSLNEDEQISARISTSDVGIKLDISRTEEISTVSVATTDSEELGQNKATLTPNPSNRNAEGACISAASIKPDEAATGISEGLATKGCSSSVDVNAEADDGDTTNTSTSSELTSACADESSAQRNSKTTKTSHHTPRCTPDPPQASGEQKGIARVIKKARKRARNQADDFINDYSDEEDTGPKRKAKKAKYSLGEESPYRKSVAGSEGTDENSTYASPEPRSAKKLNARSRSHTRSAGPRSSEEADQKYKPDKSLAEENTKAGQVLAAPRPRRTLLSASLIGSIVSPPSRSSKQLKTPASSTTPDPSDASNSSTASPRRTKTTSKSATSAPVKRKRDDSNPDSHSPRKRKATPRRRVVSTGAPRPSLEQCQSAEAKMKELIQQRTGKPPVNYSTMKWRQKEG